MAEVVLDRVTKRYPGAVEPAVNEVNLTINDGEFVVLVGPSGCGKSTTLRMIAGLEEITGGTMSIGGRVVNDVAPRDRDIAMVFQSYALYPHMTVAENMAFGLKLRKMPKAEIAKRVQGAAEMLGLTEYLARKPKALSGGQRQRVAMGRAIVRQPSVFLFDEPLSNLDAKLRVQMRVQIAALHRSLATTMVYVTHDQVEAMTLADRIAVMSMGYLQQYGTPMEVYRHPKNKFVAGFIGSPAMNFVPGKLSARGDDLVFQGHGLELLLPPAHAAACASASGCEVTLGLRPQQLHAVSNGEAVVGTGEITHTENMGSETFAHTRIDPDTTLVVRLPGDRLATVGDTLAVGVEANRFHVFDADGVNLTRETQRGSDAAA
ncbi:MAG: sn-glycerol-3-phosphate ABC transporter ATP-binding protein UgpC [Deltaproteobacteria bacterium]|nr:MAG: sn-glycerol-3-phosphate ABC transporter ATP-binding protein UgpC [Deltaproteobacteria bacterium]